MSEVQIEKHMFVKEHLKMIFSIVPNETCKKCRRFKKPLGVKSLIDKSNFCEDGNKFSVEEMSAVAPSESLDGKDDHRLMRGLCSRPKIIFVTQRDWVIFIALPDLWELQAAL